jgi:tetratricopeptide (TPR) repeat protein
VPVRLDSTDLPDFAANRIFLGFSAYPDGPNGGELLRLLHAVVGKSLSEEAARAANEQDELSKKVAATVGAAIRNKDSKRLIQLFSENGPAWQTSAALGCKAAEGLTKLGGYNEAIQMLETLEQSFPMAIRPKQLRALALARRGEGDDLMKAQEILGTLYELGERDPETLGIYARTWMQIVGTQPHPNDYWETATVAETFLIQKQYAQAGALYEAAVSMARAEVGSHQSTWKQARRLLDHLQPTEEERALIRQPFEHLKSV